jgi:hypothetical protein
MRLHVAAPLLGHGLTLGPAPWFKVDRASLVMGPLGMAVGRFVGHRWEIRGRAFTSFDLDENVTVYLEGESGMPACELGTYDDLRIIDGALYGDRAVIATYDEATDTWTSSRDGTRWATLLIMPAASVSERAPRPGR